MPNDPQLKNQIRREYIKCAQDPEYFIRNYVYIQHQALGRILFDMYDFQERSLQEILDHQFNVILKARQMGISTLVAAYALWLMTFNNGKQVSVVSMKRDTAKNIINMVKFAHRNLPVWMREKRIEDNKLSLALENDSKIFAESTTSDAGRSGSYSLMIIDEAAFIRNAEELWSSAKLTLDVGGGKAIVLSTPKDVGSWFHQTWSEAIAGAQKIEDDPERWTGTGKNEFHPIKLHWSLHPERDSGWRREQDRILGPTKAARECFDGGTKIHTDKGLKPIKDVRVGDKVLTHKGRFRRVKNKFSKIDKTVGFQTSMNKKKSFVTLNHPILDKNKNWVEFGNLKVKDKVSHYPRVVNYPKWEFNNSIDISEIYSGRFGLKTDSKYVETTDKHGVKLKRFVEVDYDLGYLIGLYLADGYKMPDNRRTTFTFNKKEKDGWPEELKNVIREKFGFDKFQEREKNNTGQLSFCNKLIGQVLDFLVVSGTGEMKGLSEESYDLGSKDYFKGVLDGLMTGDGCLTNTANKSLNGISEKIVDDIIFISSVIGYPLSSRKVKKNPKTEKLWDGRTVNRSKMTHTVSFLDTRKRSCNLISEIVSSGFRDRNDAGHIYGTDNYSVCSLTEVDNDLKNIRVYNLEVEEDHTYVTEHFVVHNCDCDFETSGDSVIDPKLLNQYEEQLICEPIERRMVRGSADLWVWEEPEPNVQYILSADVSRGDSDDYSAFHILSAQNIEQKVEYKGKIPPEIFANLIYTQASYYNDALVVVERNNYGYSVLQELIKRGYPNILYTSNDMSLVDVRNRSNKFNKARKKMKPGLDTNRKTRPLIISKLNEYFRNKYCRVYSSRLVGELRTFVWKGQKAEHMDGFNDDLVLAIAFGFWVRDTALRFESELSKMTKQTLTGFSTGKGVYTPNSNMNDPYTIEHQGNKHDIRWLL